jgi:hypothetical protein
MEDEPENQDKAKKKGGTPDRLKFGGRVYVRETLQSREVAGDTAWIDERSIESARVFLVFRPNDRMRMDNELEFSGDAVEIKDTFIRYDLSAALRVTAGRFKRPISFIGLASTLDLPRIDRGLLSEVRVEDQRLLFAGGRSEGVSLRAELGGALQPELTLTVHENDLADDLGLEVTEVNQDAFARIEIEPSPGLHLAVAGGLVGSLRDAGDETSYRHRPFGTLEAHLDTEPLRVWAEAMGGLNANAFVGADQEQIGRFAAAQVIIAPRFSKVGSLKTVEPFLAAGWYEPSTAQDGDHVGELTAGAALWVSGSFRLQLEGGRRMAQDGALFPVATDATLVRMQLSMAFESEVELR